MLLSQLKSRTAQIGVAVLALGLATACSDAPMAPKQDVVAFKAPAGFARVGVVTFRADHKGVTQRLGNHVINIPGGAICDPMVSTYGATEWDKPCTTLKKPITIVATLLEDASGRPYVDFQPALRFSPTKPVYLALFAGENVDKYSMNIEYCNNLGFCIDESIADTSLTTRRLGTSKILYRRVKHFSGYMISSGKECSESGEVLEGTCGNGGGVGMGRKSGYMVASGLAKKKAGTSTESKVETRKRYDQ